MTAKVQMIPLDELRPNPRNPKRHANDTIDKSINRFGMIEPVAVDQRTGYLIAGHGRVDTLTAMHDAGHPAPDGIDVAKGGVWKVPTLTSWASVDDTEADAALIALNQTTTLGGWDTAELAHMLEALTEGDLMAGVGFDDHDLDLMRRVLEAEGQFTMDFTDVIDEFLDGTGTGTEKYAGGSSFRTITMVFPDETSVRLFFDALGVEYDDTCATIAWPHAPERNRLEAFDA